MPLAAIGGKSPPAAGHSDSIDSLGRSVWPEQAVLCAVGDLLFDLGEAGLWKEVRYIKSGNIPEKQGAFMILSHLRAFENYVVCEVLSRSSWLIKVFKAENSPDTAEVEPRWVQSRGGLLRTGEADRILAVL